MSYEITSNNVIAAITGGVFLLTPVPETVQTQPTSFDEILIENAALDLATFGVSGIYQPTLLAREILVIIRYDSDDGQVIPGSRYRGPVMRIAVANNSTSGIDAGEFVQGQLVSIPPRVGVTAREFKLARIVKQTAGLVTFEVH